MGLGQHREWGSAHGAGRRATAWTSVECSGPLLGGGVPAKSVDRGQTPAQKPEPSWRMLLAETPSQRHVPRRTMMQSQHTGEGQANMGARFPGKSGDLAFLLLTLSAPFSLGLYSVLKCQHSWSPLTGLSSIKTPARGLQFKRNPATL